MKHKTPKTRKWESKFSQEILASEDLFMLGFLKGFDRKVSESWNNKGIWNFSTNQ